MIYKYSDKFGLTQLLIEIEDLHLLTHNEILYHSFNYWLAFF